MVEKLKQRWQSSRTLQEYNSLEHLQGETSPKSQQVVIIVKAIKAFLQAAVPLTKIDALREFLEENGHHLSHRHYLFRFDSIYCE